MDLGRKKKSFSSSRKATRNMNRRLLTMATITGVFVFAVAVLAAEEWKAPARAVAKKKPVPADATSIGRGKAVYAECLSCHGSRGKGDGPAAASLGTSPGDLTKLGGESDGSLFWKITEGKKPMPGYGQKLSEAQRWDAVNYIRGLAAKK
jgi:mono/diheme cytochrome c family protein